MADVFISYASEDRDRVRPLAEALIQRGFNVWWDRALAAGEDYAATIERELRAAKAVIVVWTRSSVASTFVRDEAGRARDEGRLVPVMLDKVEFPLGFGAFQAEDFTRWNGGSNAPQLQLLEEVLRAKLSGRAVDSSAIERRRRRLGARIRLVSLLTVIALVVGIAAGGRYLFNPPEPQTDLRAELLRLLEEGTLTPEQAIQLAEILEAGALGETQVAESAPMASPGAPIDSRVAEEGPAWSGDTRPVVVSASVFDEAARATYREAARALLQHPDASVRRAALQMSSPETRDSAMQTLWSYAQSNPNDPLRDEIYLLCGAVGEANDNPLGQRALEVAANLAPGDADVWRMLARSYDRTDRDQDAQAAVLVSQAAEAQSQGQPQIAEQRLQEALPNLSAAELRAPVASELGQLAEARGDWDSASARFAQAYTLREQTAAETPTSAAADVLEADAQQLVIALDRSGRTREACERLRQAQAAHDVAAPDQDLLERCRRLFRTQLRDRVEVAPQLRLRREAIQQTPEQDVAPTP
ncbi:MAG: TIR domain-containing protein [Hyphomonadaceae bacterium]|nr:TIR domain-containing protein [Hyphomonadaceae bacterium]